MTLTVINPFGQSTLPGWGKGTTAGAVTWDPASTVGTQLINSKLTAIAQGGPAGQGAAVSHAFRAYSGLIYWEITWTALSNNQLPVGMGFCNVGADFGALAESATGGIILYADGTIWVNGQPANPLSPDQAWLPPQKTGDAIGILIDAVHAPGFWNLNLFGVAGGVVNYETGVFQLPNTVGVVPCVIFDTSALLDEFAVTANFGANPGSFLGPSQWPDTFDPGGIYLGWPKF